jgi:two-component system sensor histidine kinase/response regulator
MSERENVRVLIAEDDHMVCEMIRGLARDVGYTIVGEATDGSEALAMTQLLRPDVVLMDIRMPGVDGIEATRQIQKQCPTPVVVVSAYETSDLIERASEAGAGAYLIKPPTTRDIERAVTIATARFDDMMELRRLTADLAERNEELDAFSYTVAHDLQNPVALIVGFAEVVGKYLDEMSAEEIREYLADVEAAARKMSHIIDQLLMLARARRVEVQMMPLDMGDIVREACQRLDNLVEKTQADLILPADWPIALGHGPWIEEVWVNYLSNALKHGSQPLRVELGASTQSDGMIQFWIRDNGPGIAPEDQGRLFVPFSQLDRARAKGHGVGLSIVARIVARLGGEAGIISEPGLGSTFTFTLPGVMEQ